MRSDMPYSRVTSKGQTTIPVKYRKKYNLKEGIKVVFEESEEGLLLKPLPDIAESAGALSRYGDLEEVLSEIIKKRKEEYR